MLFKDETKWTASQHHRAEILFRLYPSLETAYRISRKLSHIFSSTKDKGVGCTRLARWYNQVEEAGINPSALYPAQSRSLPHHPQLLR
ncbi:transposase [Hufsiella ginkgonis]|uniref:transposase n=1 Tax=Hufsiella ginkgonis TaxID=2695274 RepID=UPI0021074858|nr:transposase [Hufsiella ginkgonis]